MLKKLMKRLRLTPEELANTLNYHKRTNRRADDPVDSEASSAKQLAFVGSTPGKYKLTVDRRKRNIPVKHDRRKGH